MDSKRTVCHGCQKEFPSRNAVFSHLKKTAGACLTGEAYADFIVNVAVPDEKVILLYGYRLDHSGYGIVPTGNDAAEVLLDMCLSTSRSLRESAFKRQTAPTSPDAAKQMQRPKYLRSYGDTARKTHSGMIAQDEEIAGALTEVLATKLPPIGIAVEDWIQLVNGKTHDYLKGQVDQKRTQADSDSRSTVEPRIVLFGRRLQPGKTFNAEMDVSHRRIDYVLPGQLLGLPLERLKACLPSCQPDAVVGAQEDSLSPIIDPAHPDYNKSEVNLTATSLVYMQGLKRAMQKFTTHIVALDGKDTDAVEAKARHLRKRNRLNKKQKSNEKNDSESPETKTSSSDNQTDDDLESIDTNQGEMNNSGKSPSVKGNVLKRKSFHNFTPTVMAHEYLAKRRLDRFFHKATLHVEDNAYLLLSLTGDLFLRGQVCRVIGTWLAIHRGVVDEDFIECVFDKDYPSLVPTPPAPPQGMYAQTAFYGVWEGKSNSCLTPRSTDCYPEGWNDIRVLRAIHAFGDAIRRSVVNEWESDVDVCDRWVRETLEPWAVKAREQLEHYRKWKANRNVTEGNATAEVVRAKGSNASSPVPRPSTLDASSCPAPEVYRVVLCHLRHIYESGQWPDTSAKRQVVMVNDRANSNVSRDAATPNAGGSFSVGYMPRLQPRANERFPEFVKAAFTLERALMPDRPPSSTIAVNRNAQFRPHVDSGAGAGQSTSLIVGMGDYTGGECCIEGEEHDIRYRPMEFNGWKQRHWTLPFEGERYSLVWFTPKECQDMRGIDLALS